jgi:uncharacterized protein with PQ loop repeat
MQHFHLDKTTYRLLKKERTNIDRAMLALGVLGPIATIPQIYTIFSSQDAGSVSIVSWIFYLITAFFTLAYAAVHKLRSLILPSILWIMADIIIIAGCLIYG